MGKRAGYRFWTVQEEKQLRELWATQTPIKEAMHMFGDRSYQSVIGHAIQMGLGRRPIPVRSKFSAAWEQIRRELEKGKPLTSRELAELTGGCQRNVTDVLKARCTGEDQQVYVLRWKRAGRAYLWTELWMLGDGENAPRPRRVTQDDINRRRRERRAALAHLSAGHQFGAAVEQLKAA
ncbi:hypothetical protein [Trinickia mobilis]|uniref:hypothetical protein n=1 Tax=Trinickia mobilis TaxID=2816356 RepID=UPI001A8DA412|nr:hypothetical protein [Trinickia mobilis]